MTRFRNRRGNQDFLWEENRLPRRCVAFGGSSLGSLRRARSDQENRLSGCRPSRNAIHVGGLAQPLLLLRCRFASSTRLIRAQHATHSVEPHLMLTSRASRSFTLALLVLGTLGAAAGCTADNASTPSSAVERAMSTPQAAQLGATVTGVLQQGTYGKVTDAAIAQAAVNRLDASISPSILSQLLRPAGVASVNDLGAEADEVAGAKGTSFVIHHEYSSDDGNTELSVVRVEDAKGGVTTFAERAVTQLDSDGVPNVVASALFGLDPKSGIVPFDNVVADSSALPNFSEAPASDPQARLRIESNTFSGNASWCSTCTEMLYWAKESSWFSTLLLAHHASFLGCALAGAGGGAVGAVAAIPEGAAAGAATGALDGVVVGEVVEPIGGGVPGAAVGAAGGAVVGAWRQRVRAASAALRPRMPVAESSRTLRRASPRSERLDSPMLPTRRANTGSATYSRSTCREASGAARTWGRRAVRLPRPCRQTRIFKPSASRSRSAPTTRAARTAERALR